MAIAFGLSLRCCCTAGLRPVQTRPETIKPEWIAALAKDWFPLTPSRRLQLPPRIREWIALQTSMTERLEQVAGNPVTVDVLRQARAALYTDEHQLFATGTAHAVVREVCLSSREQPLLIARSAFTSLRLQTHPVIAGLGTRPLGSLLFAGGVPCPYTHREFARIGPHMPLFGLIRQRHRGVQPEYWGRRTVFRLFDEPLLITEIFLPALIHHRM